MNKITCFICYESVLTNKINEHMNNHKLNCTTCGTLFSNKNIENIEVDKNKVNKNIDEVQEKDFPSVKEKRRVHIRKLQNFHGCVDCDFAFETITALVLHQEEVHKSNKITCFICHESVLTNKINEHMNSHKLSCITCGTSFSNKNVEASKDKIDEKIVNKKDVPSKKEKCFK